MCTSTFMLVLLFIIKILIILIPVAIYILKRLNVILNYIKYFYLAEIIFLIILIILCIFGTDCIKNSSINGIKLNSKIFDDINYIDDNNIVIDYSSILPTKVYTNNLNTNVNYYNINYYPLSDMKLTCDKKSFFENYGNDISAITTGISTTLNTSISPFDILEYSLRTNTITCDNSPESYELISLVSNLYKVNARRVSSSELASIVNSGKIVLAKTKVNENNNLSCGNNLVIIYAFNSKGEFNILNPSDRINDYFCSSNTLGYGSIVIGDQNSLSFDQSKLDSYISDYYVLEVN